MKNLWKFSLLLFTSIIIYPVLNVSFAQQDGDDIVIGKYKTIHSKILDEDRLLFIHLPKEYKDTQLKYPVLYILYVDIYNYFADATIITEKLGGTGEIPPMIIVGVANTNRYRDFLPFQSRSIPESGGADNFLRFVEEELIPQVDDTYRTKNFRILAGPQAAAVFSLYTLINKPNLFQAFVTENPFMNPENAEFLYPKAEQFFKTQNSFRKFLYIKCEKNESPQNLEFAEKFSKLFETKKPDNFQVEVSFSEPTGYFITPLPFREALRSLFLSYKLPEQFQTNTLKDILDYYERRTEKYGFSVDPPELMLTFEGDKLNQQGKTMEALEIFTYQLSLYPHCLNVLWRLGETYREMGEYEKAKDFYRKFLEIRDIDAAMIHRRLNQVERIIGGSAAYRIEQEIILNGIQAGMKKYREIKSDSETNLYFDENEINGLGYRLMGSGDMNAALEIFKLNTELYSESANVFDSLGEAYLQNGQKDLAIKNYEKSLELNPNNNNAKQVLKNLMETK